MSEDSIRNASHWFGRVVYRLSGPVAALSIAQATPPPEVAHDICAAFGAFFMLWMMLMVPSYALKVITQPEGK